MNSFFSWLRQTVDTLCNRPDHLQRLAIIGSGMAVYPLVVMAYLVMWRGASNLHVNQIDWLGWYGVGFLMLLALVIITLLGTIKGIHISGPGGIEVQLDTTAEAKDNDAPPSQIITTTTKVETPTDPKAS